MEAIVLAAGKGTRLAPLTDRLAKAAVPLGNRPLGAYALEHLHASGITHVVVNTFHLGSTVEEALLGACPKGLSLSFSREATLLGTGGGLRQAQTFLREPNESIVVMNADLYCTPDLAAARRVHQDRDAVATMVLREVDDPERFGSVEIDDEDRVARLLGQPQGVGAKLRAHMFSGVYILSPRAFESMPKEGCVIRSAYRQWVDAVDSVYSTVDSNPWWDLGTPEAYHALNIAMARGEVPQEATLAGSKGLLSQGACIEAGAELQHCVVGSGARVRKGVKLSRCVVWANTVVEGVHSDAILTPDGVIRI